MEFIEKQKLNLWWLYIVIGASLIPLIGVLAFSKQGPTYEELKGMNFLPLGGILLPFIITFVITRNTFTLIINEEGVSYRYFPFQYKLKTIRWHTIEKAYIQKYDALSQYGGFGKRFRLWFKFKDVAYLMNDKNRGLQLEYSNGRKLLFSSNKIDELELFLINLKNRHHLKAIL